MGTTDITTASTTFVLMTGMTTSLTFSGGDALVLFTAQLSHSSGDRWSEYSLLVDSVEQTRARVTYDQEATESHPLTIHHFVSGLSAGSHTFAIHWRSQNADNTVSQSAATLLTKRSLTVIELE